MINRKEIIISEGTKGILVYCNPKNLTPSHEWLVLISYVDKIAAHSLRIYRYMSYNITLNEIHFDAGYEATWGKGDGYEFYEPTEEEKKFIVSQLTKKGYKFVPILNKVIKRNFV